MEILLESLDRLLLVEVGAAATGMEAFSLERARLVAARRQGVFVLGVTHQKRNQAQSIVSGIRMQSLAHRQGRVKTFRFLPFREDRETFVWKCGESVFRPGS